MNWPLEVPGLLVGQSEALPFWGVSYIQKKDDGYLCGSVFVNKKSLLDSCKLLVDDRKNGTVWISFVRFFFCP